MNEKARRITQFETTDFEREDFLGRIYVPAEAQAGFTALEVTVDGSHPRKQMIDTTRTYFVLEGSGSFMLNDATYEAHKGDFFIIPTGSEYSYQGQMQLFEVNISPTNSFKDRKL